MRRQELQTRLSGRGLSDIIVAGFVDPDDSPIHFYPYYRSIYFDFDGTMLEMASVGDTGYVRLVCGSVPHCDAMEEGWQLAIASLRDQLLRDTESTNQAVALRLWNVLESGDELRCAAAGIDLANGQRVFVNPWYHFGMRLGGGEEQRIWEENSTEAARVETVIALERISG